MLRWLWRSVLLLWSSMRKRAWLWLGRRGPALRASFRVRRLALRFRELAPVGRTRWRRRAVHLAAFGPGHFGLRARHRLILRRLSSLRLASPFRAPTAGLASGAGAACWGSLRCHSRGAAAGAR